MKTRSFLTALCLPLAFVACTNEEFESDSPSLNSRKQIDVVLSAVKPSVDAETRMSIDANNKFVWEKGVDMIGAALVDATTSIGATLDSKVMVNYPFTADQSGATSTFSSKSSITSGHYFFYFGYQDVLNRKGLSLAAPAQVYDANSEKSSLQQAVNYMKMISPFVNLAGGVTYTDAQAYNLDLKFVNLYTPVRVDIKSSNIPEGVTPKVNKVTLNSGSGFIVDAAADMDAIENAGVVTLNRDLTINTNSQAAALTALETLVQNGSIYHAKQADLSTGRNTGAFTLDVDGDVELSEAETTSLYILVPKGTVTGLTLKVTTTEGEYTRNISLTTPLTLADKIQPVEATLNFAQDGSGNVILPTTFDIASKADWDAAIKFMTDHAVGYLNKRASFNLTKDVTIDQLPIFNLAIGGAGRTLTLNKNFTFTSDNAAQFTFNSVKLAIGSGATLTINAQPTYITTEIINNGTLNVGTTLSNNITNYGTLNVTADATLNFANGRVAVPAAYITEKTGTININAGKALTLSAASNNLVGSISVAATATLNTSTYVLTNAAKGTIVNRGNLIAATTAPIVNAGTIDNYGSLQSKVTNTGKVIVEEDSSAKAAANSKITGGVVEIMNVSNFTSRQNDQNNPGIIYSFDSSTKVTTKVSNAAEYAAADHAGAGITDITLNGGDWILAGSYSADASKTIGVPSRAQGITLSGANLTLTAALANKTLSAEGTSSISAASAISVTNCDVNVAAGADFTVGTNITVNTLANGITQVATINGNLTVAAQAFMYFKTATVGVGATLTVKGATATGLPAGAFGVKDYTTSFNNDGTVVSEARTGNTGTAGQVSLPKNSGTGTFRGNATTFVWQ